MMKASDIMTKEVVTIKGFATVADAVKVMKEKGLRALLVEKRIPDDAYAMVTETDLVNKVAAFGLDPKAVRVYEIMTKPCITVPADLGVEYVARLFANTKIRRAPVVGDSGLLGIISISDILHKSDFVEKPQAVVYENKIQEAIANARQVCSEKGATSGECAAAWDEVEELQASAAHQRQIKVESAYESYVEDDPDARASRDYDT